MATYKFSGFMAIFATATYLLAVLATLIQAADLKAGSPVTFEKLDDNRRPARQYGMGMGMGMPRMTVDEACDLLCPDDDYGDYSLWRAPGPTKGRFVPIRG